MSTKKKPSPESIVRQIKRKIRRKYSAEDKIRIVLEGLRGEQSITDLCRREGIHPGIYYKWSKSRLVRRIPSYSLRLANDKLLLKMRY